jgi:hypothetical protein
MAERHNADLDCSQTTIGSGASQKLLRFDPDEWPAEQWWQSCELWGDACMAFVKQHPGTELGSPLTVLREKHRLYEEHRRSQWVGRT